MSITITPAGRITQQDNKRSRRFLESRNDNFLFQVTEKLMRRDDLPDLILTNKEGLIGDVKIKVSFG